jgi:hypothetical protein
MWQALTWYNVNRCRPQWSEKELRHKIAEAKKKARHGERVQMQKSGYGKQTVKPVTAAELRALSAARKKKKGSAEIGAQSAALAEYEAALDAFRLAHGAQLARAAWRVAWAGIRAQVDYMTGRVGKCDAGKWRAWAWGYSGALAETLGRAAEIIGGESVMASPLAGAQFGEVVAVHAERPKVRAQPEPADVDAAYWQFVMGSEGEARVLGDGVQ